MPTSWDTLRTPAADNRELCGPHLLGQNIQIVELDCTGVGVLQRGDCSHQGALASPVRSKQSEHVVANRQGQVFERFHAIWICLGQACDFE